MPNVSTTPKIAPSGATLSARPRPPLTWGALWTILKATLREANDDKVPVLGAALAFYSMLSVGPLLLIVIALAGVAFGHDMVSSYIMAEIQRLVGPAGAVAVQIVVTSTPSLKGSLVFTLIGIITLIISSTGFFAQLQDALNTIWDVQGKPHGHVSWFVKKRLLSFFMILGVGILLMAALVVSAALSALGAMFGSIFTAVVLHVLNIVATYAVVTVLFAMIFNILPDVSIKWRDVGVGAAITSLLFTVGKFLIGLYLGRSVLGSTYGAAGSVIVFMVWIYYSTQIFLLGAEFTQVYARYMGATVTLKKGRRRPVEVAKQVSEG
jgi:membrane protein